MEEIWHTYSTQMGEHRAVITYNHGYATISEEDPRDIALQVCAMLKHPDARGLPTVVELRDLHKIEDVLDGSLARLGAVHVGSVTCDGLRIFTFYTDIPEQEASTIVQDLSEKSSYDLRMVYENDRSKERYWKDLYPTPDDWRVILDTQVLNVLQENGDRPEIPREVFHWAYFESKEKSTSFSHWVRDNDYRLITVAPSTTAAKIGVNFCHVGTMALEDISARTIVLRRKAVELDGEYDGWETSVEQRTSRRSRMRTVATFESDVFNLSEHKDYYINEGCFGDDLGRWLVEKLRAEGAETDAEPGQEDFGWYVKFKISGERCCAVISNVAAESWIVELERDTGIIGSLFGRRSRKVPNAATEMLHRVSSTSPDICNLKWHEHHVVKKGGVDVFDDGSKNPDGS